MLVDSVGAYRGTLSINFAMRVRKIETTWELVVRCERQFVSRVTLTLRSVGGGDCLT